MERVLMFEPNDLAIGFQMERMCYVLEQDINKNQLYIIDDIIEMYNINYYINNNIYPRSWSESLLYENKKKVIEYKKIIGQFWNGVVGENVIALYNQANAEYKDTFWRLFENYQVYKRIDISTFEKILDCCKVYLYQLLKYNKIVDFYGKSIRNYIMRDCRNIELILNCYEVKSLNDSNKINFPKELTLKDRTDMIQEYIRGEGANLNYLRMIACIQNTKDKISISDKIRLETKREIQKKEKIILTQNIIEHKIVVVFVNKMNEDYSFKISNNEIEFKYNLQWIEKNIDYNTILNNFIYLFNYADMQMRITLVSRKNDLGIFEKYMQLRPKNAFMDGMNFNLFNTISDLQMSGYINQLERNGLRLEDVCQWFFDTYLKDEFGVVGFKINIPSKESTYLEKCRMLLSEMDGVLKQYGFYVEDGNIDQDLIQISSNHLKYNDCKSLVKNKYIYAKKGEFDTACFYLFSDQSSLTYFERIKKSYKSFYEVLCNEDIYMSDFLAHKEKYIKWLIEKEYISIKNDGKLEMRNRLLILIFRDLYRNEVMSYWNLEIKEQEEIQRLWNRGIVEFRDELFSKLEQDYFNYHLNKATFNNSLDLRNRYIHATQPQDDISHKKNYMVFLKLFILIIIKINDELCIVNKDGYKI